MRTDRRPASPGNIRLMLLGSPPDMVHGVPPYRPVRSHIPLFRCHLRWRQSCPCFRKKTTPYADHCFLDKTSFRCSGGNRVPAFAKRQLSTPTTAFLIKRLFAAVEPPVSLLSHKRQFSVATAAFLDKMPFATVEAIVSLLSQKDNSLQPPPL